MGYGKNIARIVIFGLLSCPLLMARQQSSQPGQTSQSTQSGQSTTDATHKTADQQKEAAKPKPVVWTNDNLPTDPNGVSVVGQPAPPPTPATANADSSATTAGGATTDKATPEDPKKIAADLAKAKADLDDAKKQLAVMQIDLAILQRQYKLDSDSYYGQTNFTLNTQGKANLDSEKAAIDSKASDVHAQEQKVSALQNVVQTLTDKQNAANSEANSQS